MMLSSGKILLAGAVALIGAGWAGQASAAVVTMTQHVNTTTAYTVSSNDLIEGLSPATGSSLGTWKGTETTNADPAVLTNGAYGPEGKGTNWKDATFTVSNASAATPDPTILIYNLDLIASPSGYDITDINTYSSWADQNRNQQYYDVSYATVSAPTTFILLKSVAGNMGVGAPSNREVLLSITDLSNVAAIKFDFSNTSSFNYTGYRELDVIGVASIPEPASVGLLAIGAMGLLARRRRQG